MKKLQVASAGLLAMVLATNLARAEPPEPMGYFEPKTPFIACDTHEEIMQLVDAMRDHKLQQKFAELAKTKGPSHGPACVYSVIGPVVFGASEHVGVVFDSAKATNLWVSHVGNPNGEFYLLWGEAGKDTSV